MATVLSLVDRTRRMLGDWPAFDKLTAQAIDTATSVAVREGGNFSVGQRIVIEGEMLYITAVSGTGAANLTVDRGWMGTTAATHASASTILVDPVYNPQLLLDGLNEGLRLLWPYFYKRGISAGTDVITSVGQADYAMPSPFQVNQGRVLRCQILQPGGLNDMWREYRRFETIRGAGGVTLHFRGVAPDPGTYYRVLGIVPFATDMTYTGNTDTELPDAAIPALTMYATHYALLYAESKRLGGAGASNIGPSGKQPGQTSALSGIWMQKFQTYLDSNGMPWPQWYTKRAF